MAHSDFGSVSDIPGLNIAVSVSVSVFGKNGEKGLKIFDAKNICSNGSIHILRKQR